MGASQLLECTDITVRFGSTLALDAASVSFAAGKIHAIVGQNGAGKTTLARVIAGLVLPAAGHVSLDGSPLPLGSVVESRSRGVQMVHQSFALPPSLTVAEALDFGGGRRRANLFSRRRLDAYWQQYLTDLGIEADVTRRIRDLPVETRQSIEIARALTTDASVLILDEPTAVLRPAATEALFERVRALRDRGVTVLMVLHKVREVLAVADTVTVLRNGRMVLHKDPIDGVTGEELAEAIVGTSLNLPSEDLLAAVGGELEVASDAGPEVDAPPANASGTPLLELKGVSTKSDQFGVGLSETTFTLMSGELVGLAGVEGNGQLSLVRTIAGLAAPTTGTLTLNGTDVTRASVRSRRRAGLRVIPFDRSNEGLSASSTLWENWALPRLISRDAGTGVDSRSLKEQAVVALDAWGVKYSSVDQLARELSGGNAQKVILAREMDEGARVVVAAQPTRGLDLGAVEFVWTALRTTRNDGSSVLLISSDLDELQELCDRILVIVSGSIVLDVRRPFDLAQIGAALTAKAMA